MDTIADRVDAAQTRLGRTLTSGEISAIVHDVEAREERTSTTNALGSGYPPLAERLIARLNASPAERVIVDRTDLVTADHFTEGKGVPIAWAPFADPVAGSAREPGTAIPPVPVISPDAARAWDRINSFGDGLVGAVRRAKVPVVEQDLVMVLLTYSRLVTYVDQMRAAPVVAELLGAAPEAETRSAEAETRFFEARCAEAESEYCPSASADDDDPGPVAFGFDAGWQAREAFGSALAAAPVAGAGEPELCSHWQPRATCGHPVCVARRKREKVAPAPTSVGPTKNVRGEEVVADFGPGYGDPMSVQCPISTCGHIGVLDRDHPARVVCESAPAPTSVVLPDDETERRRIRGSDERRAPVQGDEIGPAGTVPWSVAEQAYQRYSARYGTSQSLERLCQRGGFSYGELLVYLRLDTQGRFGVGWPAPDMIRAVSAKPIEGFEPYGI